MFNNKGGVGKTTLTFHLAHALAELGKRTLIVDLDPQCNLTIFALADETIWKMWSAEDDYIDDFNSAREKDSAAFEGMLKTTIGPFYFEALGGWHSRAAASTTAI